MTAAGAASMVAAMIGGIDLGGTKIEARLFERDGAGVAVRRVPTPRAFGAVVDAVARLARWLETGGAARVGLAMPGVPSAGGFVAANLPAGNLAAALADRLGREMPVLNDAAAFALSEARGGAAEGARVAAGLVIGTGLGAGVVRGPEATAVEVGHLGLSMAVAMRHGLLIERCACGQAGCLEIHAGGEGLRRLEAARGAAGTAAWADVVAEALVVLMRTHRPEVVALGGGLSRIEGVQGRLETALAGRLIAGEEAPRLARAVFGDTSGARGAALFAAEAAC